MYCTVKEVLDYSRGKDSAICACNVHNMEFIQGTVKAAEEFSSPIILMLAEPTIRYAGFEDIVSLCMLNAKRSKMPIAITLDHGKDDLLIKKCISAGLSVMFDGSDLLLEENILRSMEYLKLAQRSGVSLECEVGTLGSEFKGESGQNGYTEIQQAVDFYTQCKVDALAISIGNLHGIYATPPILDIDLLNAIRSQIDCPIVLHGGSNIPDLQIKRACENGVKKCNFGTDLRYAFFQTIQKGIEKDTTQFKPFGILGDARQAICEEVKKKIIATNSVNLV
jgi:ketose-bisphosphate aldolase